MFLNLVNIEVLQSKNTPSQFICAHCDPLRCVCAVQLCVLRFTATLHDGKKVTLDAHAQIIPFTAVRPRTMLSNQIVCSSKHLWVPLTDFTKFSDVKILAMLWATMLIFWLPVYFWIWRRCAKFQHGRRNLSLTFYLVKFWGNKCKQKMAKNLWLQSCWKFAQISEICEIIPLAKVWRLKLEIQQRF